MKFIFSEAANNYQNYLFSYQVMVLKEKKDSVDDIYNMGFLPVRSIKDLYYLSRSCRVDLSKFELSSENKRVIKQLDGTHCKVIDKKEYLFKYNEFVEKIYLNNASTRLIFSGVSNYNKVFDFDKTGIVVTMVTDNMIHYAHSFYKREGCGIPMMAYIVNYAKEQEKKYIYLGTCYEINSLYKAQYKGFEFFDGISWSADIEKLKNLVKNDNKPKYKHLLQDVDYMQKFYGVTKLGRLIKKLRNE